MNKPLKHSRTRLMAVFVVLIASVLAIASSFGDSLIVDEVPHIGAGYSYVSKLDFRLNPEHPPLAKDLAALPLLTLRLDQNTFASTYWTKDVNGQWNFGRSIIFNSGKDADLIKNVARFPMILFFLAACYLVWRWSYERYGDTAALIATTLFAFSPTIIAHSRFVTTDMAAATTILAASYFFLRFLRSPDRKNFIWASLTLGLALLAKFNTVLLGPYFLLVALLYGLDGQWGKRKAWLRAGHYASLSLLIGLVAFCAVVWPVYVLQTWNYPMDRQVSDTKTILNGQSDNILKSIALWSSDKPIIRAAGHWTLGLAMVAQRSGGGNTIYWLGQVVKEGGPLYFPIVYFLKEPLAWWMMFAMALTALAFHRHRHKGEPKKDSWWSRNTEEWMWLLWLAIYWVISMRSTLNIGIRHMLPVYAFTIMLVAGRLSILVDWLKHHEKARLKYFSIGIAVLLGWYTFESVSVYPNYLTYFNQIAGGPSGGYRYVTDSNLDWGQDLRRLADWVSEQRIRRISLDYFGWASPQYYLKEHYVYTTVAYWKDAKDFIARNNSDGWIAVSATFLQEAIHRTDQTGSGYRWLLNYEPVTAIGNSIFVYHITK